MFAERDGMKPSKVAVETFGGDATEAPQEALSPAVATAGRLDVQGVRGDHRRQHRAGERAEGPAAGLAAIAAKTARALGHRAAVSSSMFENQSRNRTLSISLSPMFNANREPVHLHARELQIEPNRKDNAVPLNCPVLYAKPVNPLSCTVFIPLPASMTPEWSLGTYWFRRQPAAMSACRKASISAVERGGMAMRVDTQERRPRILRQILRRRVARCPGGA